MYIVVTWEKEHKVNKSRKLGLCYGVNNSMIFVRKTMAVELVKKLAYQFPHNAYAVLKVEGKV